MYGLHLGICNRAIFMPFVHCGSVQSFVHITLHVGHTPCNLSQANDKVTNSNTLAGAINSKEQMSHTTTNTYVRSELICYKQREN